MKDCCFRSESVISSDIPLALAKALPVLVKWQESLLMVVEIGRILRLVKRKTVLKRSLLGVLS